MVIFITYKYISISILQIYNLNTNYEVIRNLLTKNLLIIKSEIIVDQLVDHFILLMKHLKVQLCLTELRQKRFTNQYFTTIPIITCLPLPTVRGMLNKTSIGQGATALK